MPPIKKVVYERREHLIGRKEAQNAQGVLRLLRFFAAKVVVFVALASSLTGLSSPC
ncbi:MAG: hypothetical protein ABSH21_07580 [Verrucomicrobiia bacterium]|jgi:hypothetical protein